MVGDVRLESKDEIVQHIQNYFISLYSKDQWNRPSFDNLDFATLEFKQAQWLQRKFEEEVRAAIFALVGDKTPGPEGFLWPSSSASGKK